MIIKYTFNDGAVLVLHNVGLSDDEVLELEDIHGKCVKVAPAQTEINPTRLSTMRTTLGI